MASVGEGDCHKDPNFAVVCSFLDKYGASLGLEPISYSDLQTYLEDTTGDVSRVLIDIHVRLLRRIGKSMVNSDRFEKGIIKFCHNFSEFDAWEVESYGYKHAQLATKLRILKNLLECQFDYNLKFKEKINGESAEEMRLLPIGRDKEGQAYWYFLDHDLNLLVYKEEQDDEVADTWKLVCSNRTELANLVNSLQKVSGKEEEDKASTCESRSSKEGSPEKDANAEKVAQDLAVEVKAEKKQEVETDVKGKQIIKEDEGTVVGVKKKEAAIEQFEIVKKEVVIHEEGTEKGDISAQEQVVDSIRVKRTNKKAAEVVKKEKTAKEPVAKTGKRVEVHLVDIMKDQKSVHEEMDADSEKVLKELTGTVVKTENTLHLAGSEEIKIENSDKVAVSTEAETDKSVPVVDSGHERVEPEAETVKLISNSTNTATTDESQDSDKTSGHSGELKSSKSVLSTGQKSAELELTASEDADKVPEDDTGKEPDDDAGGGSEAKISDESVDKGETDCRLQTAKSPGLEASPLSDKTSVLNETHTEENNIEIQERNPVVAEEDQVKTKIGSEVSANQTEDGNSTSVVDLEPAKVKSQSEVDQKKSQVRSEIVEGSSDGTLKETPCSTEENTDTEKTTPVSSDQLEVQPADKMSSSDDPVLESNSAADGGICDTLTSSTVKHKTTTESIQATQERPASEPKDQQTDCETLRVETKSELNDGAVDLCITAKEVMGNIPPPALAADDDTDTVQPESCDTSISSADVSCSGGQLHKHKESDNTEQNHASMQLSPEPGVLDQADPKSCCQDSSSSINEKSMTEITSEGLNSGALLSSPECLSVNADNQQEKSNKLNESHSSKTASSTHGGLEAAQNTNVDEDEVNTDVCESDDQPENPIEVTGQTEPENSVEGKSQKEPENSVEGKSEKEPENSVEEKGQKEPENSVEEKGQKEPENSVEEKGQKEPENSVEEKGQKEPENSVEEKSQKEPENSVEEKSKKEQDNSVEEKSQKEQDNSVEVTSQNEPENPAEERVYQEPENLVDVTSQKKPEHSGEEKSKKEPENSTEVKSQQETENSAEEKSQQEQENSTEVKSQQETENSAEEKSQKEHENSTEEKSQKEYKKSAEEKSQKEYKKSTEEKSQKEHEHSTEEKSQHEPENSTEVKSQQEPEKDSAPTKLDNIGEKELTETCEQSQNVENTEAITCVEPMNEDSENKPENVADIKTIKDIKTSRRKRKAGKNSKKRAKMVNGHTDNSDSTLNQISKKSLNETAEDDGVKCDDSNVDDSNVDDSFSRRPKRSLVSQIGRAALRNKKCAVKDNTSSKCANSVVNNTSVGSENSGANVTSKNTDSALANETFTNSESSLANDIPTSNTPSRRKLKRSVPEPASDEPVDSEPNGKRAKQATKAQKTRAGRNAAARGRSARMTTRDSESDDSDDTPLSQVRSRGQGLARGAGGRRTRGQACQRHQNQPNQESAQDEEGEEGNASKLGKKKKPDSSTEVLSEEDATPAKKGRNQTQASTPTNSKNSNKSKGAVGKKPTVQTTPAPAPEDDAGMRRSLRVRQQRARRPPTPSSSSETSDDTSEDELSSEEEEEAEPDKDFLDSSFTPEEDSGDEEFMPKGRNFQRQAARTSKEEAEAVVNDDTPCVKCGKYNHPEMILLCDKCDAGYHTACLRPPLMLIPDGDWFCPPCEHAKLVEKLLECLQSFDLTIKKKDRLNKRQERLAFVGISISNILHGDRKVPQSPRCGGLSRQTSSHNEDDSLRENKAEGEEAENHDDSASTSSYESKPEPKRMYRSERLALRQAQKRSRKDKHRQNRIRHKRSPELEVLTQRTCRTRGAVSYQFKEFDELINNAIEDDKPFRREKPPGISRGKDMSNILGASDEEDEKIRQRDGEEIQPPPVVKKKCKRRLTKLDSDEDPDDDEEESDEFKLSEEEDSDATEVEEDAEDESGSSDSGNWQPKRTWYNSHTSSRRAGRRLHNFVVDDDYNSDENAAKRRSTRNSNRGRIHYSDWDSNEETEEEASASENSSDGSLYGRKKSQKQQATRIKQKGASSKKQKDSHDSDSSITIRRKNLRRLIKKRRKDESESEDSEKEVKSVKEVQKKEKEEKEDSEGSHFVNEEESHEESDDSPRFKKKNVLRSSDEDETEPDVTDFEPVVEASEVCSKSEGITEVDTLLPAAIVAETEEEPAVKTIPDNTISMKSDIDAKTKEDNSVKMKSEIAVKTIPDNSVKMNSEIAVNTIPDNSVKVKSDIAAKTKPDNSLKGKSDIAVKTKPANTIKLKSDIAVKAKPKTAAKGKKRSDWCDEDKVTILVTDVAVPGKVRRMSTSDREPERVADAAPLLPVPEVSVSASEKKPQRATESKVNEKVPDVALSPVDQKTSVSETGGSNREPSPVKEKSAGSGKKRTVPNFLDVNSGEESDEHKQDEPKDSAIPSSFIADVANVQTTAASKISSDGAKTRVDHMEGPQHHRNFPHPSQHYPYSAGPYGNSAQGAPYAHRQVTGSPQNLGQMGREPGPLPQNANMLNAAPHNGPPGLIRGFPDPVPHQPSTEGSAMEQGGRPPHSYTEGSAVGQGGRPPHSYTEGSAVGQGGRPPHSYTEGSAVGQGGRPPHSYTEGSAVGQGGRPPHSYAARGPRPNLAHSFPSGVRHSSQGVEPGQNMSKGNPEHGMPHPGYQGIPVGHYPPGSHMRSGQAQPHRGMQPPFYMGQQQQARPGMDNDSGSNMGSYVPQNYGARRMPSAAHFGQDLSANAVRNPYYGMQTSPPHNMGPHFSRQYPVGMGPGPHNMSSPLTSMGQMARKLGSGSDMHSPPNTQNVGSGDGPKERRSSLGSPPNPEAVHRQEKLVEIREIKTESIDDDLSVKKVGKKRTVSSKPKKKTSEPNMATHDMGQQGPASATSHAQMAGPTEGQDRVSGPGQLMGNYRGNSQPYHMPPYQMPYPHGSNVNQLQMTQGPYMNQRHTPPAVAHQRSKADVNNTPVKSGEGKWNRAENMETQCGTLPSRSPVHMSSYHQNFPKSQPSEQTISSQERRHSVSPGSQASDASSSDRMKEPASVDQMSLRKQTVDVKPHIQGLPPTAHTTETSPDFGGAPAGQAVTPTSQDHRLHANTHGHNIPQYSHAGGANSSEAPRAYYNPSSYYPRGPDTRKPMSQNNTWNPDPQGHGMRYGPPGYPYGMNPSAGNRMPTIKSEFGSHSHSNSDLAGVPEKGSTGQDSSTKDDPVNMVTVGEQHRPVLQKSTSSECPMVKNTESGQSHPQNVELDIKPNIRHTDAGPEGAENVSLSEPQRPQASLSESVSSLSSSATSTSPSTQTKLVAHDVTNAALMCKQSTSVEQPSFHHSTSSGMNQPHQVSPVTSMAPHSPWPRPNSSVQYSHQHMNQWANMGGPPSHYNMNRSYGGPGVMPHPAYGMDSQSSSIRPNPGQVDQKPFMHPNYESRFQPPYQGMRPAGPETEYHRAGFNPDYSPAGRYPPQLQNCPRRPDGGSHPASHAGDVGDQVAELNTGSKPKRAKTQRKAGKDAAVGAVRGKSSKGRGRGRGGFMIDNLLQARGGEVEEGEDSSEMNDIVSYVTTDEYFKQQTSCDSFKHAPDVGVVEKKL